MNTDAPSLLEAHAVCKTFGMLKANDDVSLKLRSGSIHALIGENGAGKSTLVSILCGLVKADSGTLYWRGEPMDKDGATVRRTSIGVVFQHFALVEQLTVADNIALGVGKSATQIMSSLQDIASRYGISISAERQVSELSMGEKQRVEILRCLLQNPQLLILDEPTSVLTPSEVDNLFVLLKQLADEGRGILFISHKLDEVCTLCDTASVLRQGRMVATEVSPATVGREQLIHLMLGDATVASAAPSSTESKHPPVLEVCELSLPSSMPHPLSVQHLSLRPGTIMGIAGISGNGQDALLDCLSGEMQLPPSMLLLDGKPAGDWGCRKRAEHGVLCVPTERNGRAAVGELSLSENGLLGMGKTGGKVHRGFLRSQIMHDFANDIINKFSVRADSPDSMANSLSGGNLQKFIIGRTLAQSPRVLLMANPTWGVDVRAAAFIRAAIGELRDSGGAVLLISEDLDELFEMCDEIAVLNSGVLSQPFPRAQATIDYIGDLMARGTGQMKADSLT